MPPPAPAPQAFKAALQEAEQGQRRLVALDCGAGVGRVSEQLLLHHFQEVDLVEPSGGRLGLCGGSDEVGAWLCIRESADTSGRCRWRDGVGRLLGPTAT